MVRHGFTLVEIIVVIAIIAILGAILFPVGARARERAKLVDGSARMRQAGISLLLYQSDNNDWLPSRDTALGVMPSGVRCHPNDTWEPNCTSRSQGWMVASYGYGPMRQENPEVLQGYSGCLLAHPFSGYPAVSAVMEPNPQLDDPCVVNLTCRFPDRLEFLGTDGALKTWKGRRLERMSQGPYSVFNWRMALDLCSSSVGE